MKHDAQYDSLIQRSNEINADKKVLNRKLEEGKHTVKVKGKRVDINTRREQLDREHREIINEINRRHAESP